MIIPVDAFTVATKGEALDHVPPETVLEKVVVLPIQTTLTPVIEGVLLQFALTKSVASIAIDIGSVIGSPAQLAPFLLYP